MAKPKLAAGTTKTAAKSTDTVLTSSPKTSSSLSTRKASNVTGSDQNHTTTKQPQTPNRDGKKPKNGGTMSPTKKNPTKKNAAKKGTHSNVTDKTAVTENGVDLRRVYTFPVRALESKQADNVQQEVAAHCLDRFGFITNMDSHGNIHDIDTEGTTTTGSSAMSVPTFAEMQRNERRTKKWNAMMATWSTTKRRRKLVLKRLRKGVPHDLRGSVWALLGNVEGKIKRNPGLYQKLVRQSAGVDDAGAVQQDKSFRAIQETIERDIHRTYPRHAMFYDDGTGGDTNEAVQESAATDEAVGLCGTTEISTMIRDLECNVPAYTNELSPTAVLELRGGQPSLRRVLKAYSLYDREIGYCQGMNFIVGMFLTFMTEEESFWLLVAVMYDQPCKMRGLFGEGMRETHKVLYVAEKLIHQFLPKVAKHLDKEHIHITMFATQWLLTQYTSSFKFDVVTRIWDCFLSEGWKITYRVMLAMLQQWQSSLVKMSFEDILAFFRELPDRVDGAKTIEIAMKIPLRRKHIAKLEKEWDTQQAEREQS